MCRLAGTGDSGYQEDVPHNCYFEYLHNVRHFSDLPGDKVIQSTLTNRTKDYYSKNYTVYKKKELIRHAHVRVQMFRL
jgi:hypothetical protein